MEIVHLWDQAGVACILAKYQRLSGHESQVIISNIDKYGIYDFYKPFVINVKNSESSIEEHKRILKRADIIHIHGRIDWVVKIHEQFGKSKKIVLHYHGTDIRGLRKYNLPHRSVASDLAVAAIFTIRKVKGALTLQKLHEEAQRLADLVIVSTPDLLELVSDTKSLSTPPIYLQNPVDTEHFRSEAEVKGLAPNASTFTSQAALTFNTEAIDIELAIKKYKQSGIPYDLKVYDRTKDPVMYKDMPAFLRKYKTYVDIRYVNGKLLKNLSKTALEALSCGLEVIDFDIKSHNKLPPEHEPLNVAKKLDAAYDKI